MTCYATVGLSNLSDRSVILLPLPGKYIYEGAKLKRNCGLRRWK